MRITLRDGVIAAYCKQHDISRDEMSRRMGVASTTAFRVEKGDVDPSPRFIASLMLLTNEPFESMFEVVRDEKVAS